MRKKKQPFEQADFYEPIFPGKIIGKEVLDKCSRRLGIVKSLKVEYLPWKISLIIKGKNLELPVDISEVENIGTVIQLKTKITAMPEIDINETINIKNELKEELKEISQYYNF